MPPSKADADLYGLPRPKPEPKDVLPTSTSNAFASHLSSLLSSSSSTSTARPRPSKSSSGKDDIFTTHNRGSKKRALADDTDTPSTAQKHSTSLAPIDSSDRHRAKRKMEEKARIYAAMKRGDYIDPRKKAYEAGDERGPLVDFDRKWAEADAAGKDDSDSSSGDDNGSESEIEYTDEFGRLRKGTRGEALREERRRRAQRLAQEELDQMSGRPAAQEQEAAGNMIFGDTVQAAAFNPDQKVAEAMEELARKRDRSLTPPEKTHYDASKEVRSKGVGFYQFSREDGVRKGEMESLEGMRKETEGVERERVERREKREREREERKRKIREKREGREADKFLDSLG